MEGLMAAVNYKMADCNRDPKNNGGGKWGVRSQERQNALRVFLGGSPFLGCSSSWDQTEDLGQ